MTEPISTPSQTSPDRLHRLILPCNEVVKLISEAMDRPLPLGTQLRLRVHLLMCDACARYRQQLQSIRETLRTHPDQLTGPQRPTGPSSETRERLIEAMRKRQQP